MSVDIRGPICRVLWHASTEPPDVAYSFSFIISRTRSGTLRGGKRFGVPTFRSSIGPSSALLKVLERINWLL